MLGIHLGANYTRIAIMKDEHPSIVREIDIPRDGNSDRLASVLSYRSGREIIGIEALKNKEREIIFDSCRPSYVPAIWHAERNPEGTYQVHGKNRELETITQEDAISKILIRVKEIVDARYDCIEKVVISYPHKCGDEYKQMIQNAAQRAGFNDIDICKETLAAALSFYEISKPDQNPHYLLVFIFTAGSFSISLATRESPINDQVVTLINTTGSTIIGGEDFTKLLMCYFHEQFNENNDFRLKDLRESCERVKSDLSYFSETKLFLDEEPLCEFTRDDLEKNCKPIIDDIKQCMNNIAVKIKQKGLTIHDVLLVGGSTRLHFIRDIIDSTLKDVVFEDDTNFKYHYDTIINREEAIALGCAIYASTLANHQIVQQDTRENSMESVDPIAPFIIEVDQIVLDIDSPFEDNINTNVSENNNNPYIDSTDNKIHTDTQISCSKIIQSELTNTINETIEPNHIENKNAEFNEEITVR